MRGCNISFLRKINRNYLKIIFKYSPGINLIWACVSFGHSHFFLKIHSDPLLKCAGRGSVNEQGQVVQNL